MDWDGFTDEDLQRMKQTSGSSKGTVYTSNRGGAGRLSSGQASRGRGQQQRKPNMANAVPITASQMLSKPAPTTEPKRYRPPAEKTQTSNAKQRDINTNQNHEASPSEADVVNSESTVEERKEKSADKEKMPEVQLKKELDEKEGKNRELSRAEHFQEQQKIMEEQNKKKKELLFSAIQQRQKKAKAESQKLLVVQRELAQLDKMVNADVSILRDQIEHACLDFMDAQRRYEKAEKEFVESKIDLHKKSERKEQLTEHLYTVIHQNELRKAKKLGDIMNRLALEGDDDSDVNMTSAISEMPQLSVLNSPVISMQTFKGPTSPTRLSSSGIVAHIEEHKAPEQRAVTTSTSTGQGTGEKARSMESPDTVRMEREEKAGDGEKKQESQKVQEEPSPEVKAESAETAIPKSDENSNAPSVPTLES